MLAPRMNAAGRMSTPDIVTRLLLATDEALGEEARALALQLEEENVRRQTEEAGIVASAKKIVQSNPDIGARSVLVVAGEGWHRGVIGIVASKLVDAFNRPAIVLSIDEDVAHGSCRSIPQFDMLGALERCAGLMIRFGGHKQAAGLTIDTARIGDLRAAVNAIADEQLGPEDLMRRLRIDGDLGFRAITGAVASGVAALAPSIHARCSPRVAWRSSMGRASSKSGTSRWRCGRRDGSSEPSSGARPSGTTSSPSTRVHSTSPSHWNRTSTMERHTSS
jgi:single-stranded-DNA-specific exonuclease